MSAHRVIYFFMASSILLQRCIQSAEDSRLKAERLAAASVFGLRGGKHTEMHIPELLFCIVQEWTPVPLDMTMDDLIRGRDMLFNLFHRPLWTRKCAQTIQHQLSRCNRNSTGFPINKIVFAPALHQTIYVCECINRVENNNQWFLLRPHKKVQDLRRDGLSNVSLPYVTYTYGTERITLEGLRATGWIMVNFALEESSNKKRAKLHVGWGSPRCHMTSIRQFSEIENAVRPLIK